MNLISCKNLFIYYGKNLAVENLSFTIKEKDYIVIVGENGSGKSSLLKAILNLNVKFKGDVVFENLKRNHVGYLPQLVDGEKNFPAIVFEIVLSGFVNCSFFSPFYGEKEKKTVSHILKKLNMYELRNESFRNLSKGQQQKILLARAICSSKKILFLDEPCSSLDPIFKREFYSLAKELNEEKNIAVVMVSHDVKDSILNAKKVLHMDKKALFFGDVSDYVKTKEYKYFLKGE